MSDQNSKSISAIPIPQIKPERSASLSTKEFNSLNSYINSFVYIWLTNDDEFWFFPINVTRFNLYGYKCKSINDCENTKIRTFDIESFY